jgi:hypothetical protein
MQVAKFPIVILNGFAKEIVPNSSIGSTWVIVQQEGILETMTCINASAAINW